MNRGVMVGMRLVLPIDYPGPRLVKDDRGLGLQVLDDLRQWRNHPRTLASLSSALSTLGPSF